MTGRVYFHLFQVPSGDDLTGGWRYLLHDCLCKMEASGLLDAYGCDVVMVGDERQRAHITSKDWITQYKGAHLLEEHDISTNDGWWELRTLQRLWQDAIDHHSTSMEAYPILYCHTKGSLTENRCLRYWREYMQAFLIEDWKNCVERLIWHGCDTCGVDLRPFGGMHYSGNFWWARSDWIASLAPPHPVTYYQDQGRMAAEYWVLHRPGKHYPLFDSRIEDLYRGAIPRKDYAHFLKRPLP